MQPDDIGRIVSASDPKISPDGSTVAYVVSRVDLEANKLPQRDLAGRRRRLLRPVPVHRRRARRQRPGVGTGRPPPGVHQPAVRGQGRQAQGHAPRRAGVDPGEVVTLAERDEGFGELAWSPDGTRLAFTSREKLVEEEDERKRPPRKIDRLFSRLDSVGWTIDRPNRVWSCPSTAPRRRGR